MVLIRDNNAIVLSITASICLVATYLPGVFAGPYILNDDRVRSLDVTPVLGRGYSIMTNSFQSTCMTVNQTTVPSYNYDCKLILLVLSYYS